MKQEVVVDPFADASDEELLSNPRFHQQKVFAIIMRILARFERALGRRVSWSFGGHQLKVARMPPATRTHFTQKMTGDFSVAFLSTQVSRASPPLRGKGWSSAACRTMWLPTKRPTLVDGRVGVVRLRL